MPQMNATAQAMYLCTVLNSSQVPSTYEGNSSRQKERGYIEGFGAEVFGEQGLVERIFDGVYAQLTLMIFRMPPIAAMSGETYLPLRKVQKNAFGHPPRKMGSIALPNVKSYHPRRHYQ